MAVKEKSRDALSLLDWLEAQVPEPPPLITKDTATNHELDEVRDRLCRKLRLHHVGAQKAITVNRLAAAIGWQEKDRSCPSLRALIHEVVRQGVPIGSCAKGYFLISSRAELESYTKSLQERSRAIMQRADDVIAAFEAA